MKYFLLSFVVLAANIGHSQQLSDSSRVSIITCGPDPGPVYLAFGHSAIRVEDPLLGLDYAFNYGVFDFNQPNFYLNFARGSNRYMLGAYNYRHFRDSYIEDNRFLNEQVLNLTLAQRQKLYDFLVWNSAPENRAYWYDPYYDNCATRVRDAFVKVFGDDVRFDGSYIKTDYTIRQLVALYADKNYAWGNLGIDIAQGMPIDKKAAPYEYMFLPAYVESGFDNATIVNDSTTVPLVASEHAVYESTPFPDSLLPRPMHVMGFIGLIALILCARDFRKQELSTWFDVLLFGLTGLIGIVLLLLWFLTDHKASADNLNLIWALPTHFIIVFAFFRQPRWLGTYFLVTAIIQLLLLITWFYLPQQLNTALIPVVVALMMRAYIHYLLRKRRIYNRPRIAKEAY